MSEKIDEIKEKKQEWINNKVKPALKRFGLTGPQDFYTPDDLENFDFLTKVGFPGEYPFTAGTYPINPYAGGTRGGGAIQSAPGLRRAGRYSGYGTAEDTRDYYKLMAQMGSKGGPNLAFDLPTQCGYDSDSAIASGEVGKTGVAIDTLRDIEILFEAFQNSNDLNNIASNFTINAPANMIMAMYFALAEKRGINLAKLRGTPQNDILKEYVSRGTYIFPPTPSMKLFRDSVEFFSKYVAEMNITSIGGITFREAGATREQDLGFSMAIGIAYLQEGLKTGLDIDNFAPKFTFNAFGGSMEIYKEIAFHRATRRMWAKIVRNEFGANNPKSWQVRMPIGPHIGLSSMTSQRPLNNLTRAALGGIASAMCGYPPNVYPPFDEALGLGWSLEAIQLSEDAGRILKHESKVTEIMDPFAGSYFMESLTDQIEEGAWRQLKKVKDIGGAVAAIESGYMQKEIAKAAYERQHRIEKGEELIIGVNCFVGEDEIDVRIDRMVPHPYDSEKREGAEATQIQRLKEIKRTRDNTEVKRLLHDLEIAVRQGDKNLIPLFIESAKAYVTLQEMCDVLRGQYGEYVPASIL